MWQQLNLLLDRKTQESEKEFYGLIGLVEVRFARLEAQLTELLSNIIHPNNEFLATTLTEDIFFAKTVELIKKIGHMRPIDEKLLNEIVSEANSLRRDRNDYMHSIWEIKLQDNGYVTATCSRRKISFKQKGTRKSWSLGYPTKTVTLNGLKGTAIKLESLSLKVQKLIHEIKEDPNGFEE